MERVVLASIGSKPTDKDQLEIWERNTPELGEEDLRGKAATSEDYKAAARWVRAAAVAPIHQR